MENDFRSWQDFISGRSKTVKDLLDLAEERYPNARGFNVFVASNVSVWKTDGIRLRTGCDFTLNKQTNKDFVGWL